MTIHEQEADRLFREGYNCAQSVFVAFRDIVGIDEKTALRLSSTFGGGMGRMREVCGAVTGMLMVLGYTEGYDTTDMAEKKRCYARVQEMMNRFRAEFGSYQCRDILKVDGPQPPEPAVRDEAFYNSRPCLKCIKFAARLLDEA